MAQEETNIGQADLTSVALRLVSQRLPLVMWSCDEHLRVTWTWGSGLEALHEHENEHVGASLSERMAGENDAPTVIEAHKEALAGQDAAYDITMKGRDYRGWVTPYLADDGRVVGVIGVALDVTDEGEGPNAALEQEAIDIGRALGRSRVLDSNNADEEVIVIGDLNIDVGAWEVSRSDDPIDLTPTEFRLLLELARARGRVVTRRELLHRVWGYDLATGAATINTTMMRLRAKLTRHRDLPPVIETVRGVGYRIRRR